MVWLLCWCYWLISELLCDVLCWLVLCVGWLVRFVSWFLWGMFWFGLCLFFMELFSWFGLGWFCWRFGCWRICEGRLVSELVCLLCSVFWVVGCWWFWWWCLLLLRVMRLCWVCCRYCVCFWLCFVLVFCMVFVWNVLVLGWVVCCWIWLWWV